MQIEMAPCERIVHSLVELFHFINLYALMADESKTFGQGAGVTMYVQPLSRIGFGTNWYNGGSMLRSAISITVKMTRTL